MRDLGLVRITVTFSTGIGGVRGPVRIIILEPAIGPVINGQAENRHVVGIHHSMDEPHPHPVGNHHCSALADFPEPFQISLFSRGS